MGLLGIFKTKRRSMDLPPPPLPLDADAHAEEHAVHQEQDTEQQLNQYQSYQSSSRANDMSNFEIPEIQPPPMLQRLPQMQESQQPEFLEPSEITPPPLPISLHDNSNNRQLEILPKAYSVSPQFVSSNDYQQILNSMNEVRKQCGDADNIIAELTRIKNSQEKLYSQSQKEMEGIERKIAYVDSVIEKNQQNT